MARPPPRPAADPCCSRWGYSGATAGYCSSPGLDSRDLGECSCRTVDGAWRCGPVAYGSYFDIISLFHYFIRHYFGGHLSEGMSELRIAPYMRCVL